MTTVPSGKLILLQDLIPNAQQYDNTSIRVTGRLTYYDPTQNTAIMEYRDASLRLNTDIVTVYPPIGAMIQCIGETKYDKDVGQLVLTPRILKMVETLNMDVYEKTVSLINQYHDAT